MASIFTPTSFGAALGPYQIDINDCMGDSVGIINANTNYLASFTSAVSSTTSTQINTLSSLIYIPPAGGIIEYLSNVCDGSQVQGRTTTYTWPNVTTEQKVSNTYVDVTGSILTYTPPPNTKKVIYRFNFLNAPFDSNPILHWRFYIDNVEVLHSRFTTRADAFRQGRDTFEWAIAVGGTTNTDTGRQATWTTPKELKLTARSYSAGYEGKLHATRTFDGVVSSQFSLPTLTVIATT